MAANSYFQIFFPLPKLIYWVQECLALRTIVQEKVWHIFFNFDNSFLIKFYNSFEYLYDIRWKYFDISIFLLLFLLVKKLDTSPNTVTAAWSFNSFTESKSNSCIGLKRKFIIWIAPHPLFFAVRLFRAGTILFLKVTLF